MIACAIGKPGWHFYMAYDGGVPIATGASYIDGRYCWIDFAATMAEHRGKGAQTALAARRIQDAGEQGCKWLVVETAEQSAEKEAPSYRNMIRLGFKVAYVRPNYIMKF
jgi:GNAT superfamily N-acetyltransferase